LKKMGVILFVVVILPWGGRRLGIIEKFSEKIARF